MFRRDSATGERVCDDQLCVWRSTPNAALCYVASRRLESGAEHHPPLPEDVPNLYKPFSIDRLLSEVARLLGAR